MNRLAKLRLRSSVGLNASSTSMSNAAGYETANDESINSACSMYYSMTEGEEALTADAEKTIATEGDNTLSAEPTDVKESGTTAKADQTVDQTLENDFSLEEVSTIRKAEIAKASPATVKVASNMTEKYLGVSSTPAKTTKQDTAKTPTENKENLSGIAFLDQKHSSVMKKMREPLISDMSLPDIDESKFILDNSAHLAAGEEVPVVSNKSFGTNVLSDFFASLNVNKNTPVPEIKVEKPEGEDKISPRKTRRSNSLQNLFDSLKKPVVTQAVDPKKNVRKSLITKLSEGRPKMRNSLSAISNDNRVASPINKQLRKSSVAKLIPEKLKEMRKIGQTELVSLKRKSIIPPPKAISTILTKSSGAPPVKTADIVGDSLQVNGDAKREIAPPKPAVVPKPLPNNALKRKSVVPAMLASRRSVLPAKQTRRSVVPATGLAPPKIALKVPVKTTLSTSDTTRRTTLGKRPNTQTGTSKIEPPVKARKSITPVKESIVDSSPKDVAKPISGSRIRPPSIGAPNFKKPETFACDVCQRTFRLKYSLDNHKKVHQNGLLSPVPGGNNSSGSSDAAPVDTKCRYCAKSFANAKILSNHIVSNCVKIPLLEKRKLLAESEQKRASSARTPELTRTNGTRITRPATSSSASRTKHLSVDSNCSDQSTSSSAGESANNSTSKNQSTGNARKRTVGHVGISRTPNKEMKCHICDRKFLIAVEYATHVQAHTRAMESLNAENKQEVDVSLGLPEQKEVTALVKKLTSIRSKPNK